MVEKTPSPALGLSQAPRIPPWDSRGEIVCFVIPPLGRDAEARRYKLQLQLALGNEILTHRH